MDYPNDAPELVYYKCLTVLSRWLPTYEPPKSVLLSHCRKEKTDYMDILLLQEDDEFDDPKFNQFSKPKWACGEYMLTEWKNERTL